MILWGVLLTLTDISSVQKQLKVERLPVKDSNEEKRKEIGITTELKK